MLEEVKNFFGAGKSDAAALVREVVRGSEPQDVLFIPENVQVLRAYVEYGHSFDPSYFSAFLEVAERPLIKTYLQMGFDLGKEERRAVLELNDEELTQVMMDSGSWVPFPFGNGMSSPLAHHELELCEHGFECEPNGVATA